MKIENMEQVKQNLGKRVLFQCEWDEEPATGKIVYGEAKDCDGDIVGCLDSYSVICDFPDDNSCTWYNIEGEDSFQEDIVLFETLED